MKIAEAKKELFYYGKYTQFCPPGDRRIYTSTTYNEQGPWITVDSNRTGRLFPMTDIPLMNIDRTCMEQTSAVDFSRIFEAYKKRMFLGETEYSRMISDFAEVVCAMIKKNSITPDAFIAMPTRNEVVTSHAFNVIKNDFINHGKNPFFLILHNSIEDPREEVLADLQRVRKDDLALVLDLKFTSDDTIRDVRAILSDVVMEVNERIKDSTGRIIPMVIADADTTRVTPGTYANQLDALTEDLDFDLISAYNRVDYETIMPDKKMAILLELANLFESAKYELDFGFITGPSALINMRRFPAFGNFPRLNAHEDFNMYERIRQANGKLGVLGIAHGGIFTDASLSIQLGQRRYDVFGKELVKDRTIRGAATDLSKQNALDITLEYLNKGHAVVKERTNRVDKTVLHAWNSRYQNALLEIVRTYNSELIDELLSG